MAREAADVVAVRDDPAAGGSGNPGGEKREAGHPDMSTHTKLILLIVGPLVLLLGVLVSTPVSIDYVVRTYW